MIDEDRSTFFDLLADVYAFYGRDFSAFAGSVWWQALTPFDLPAVRSAFGRNCANPDTGQFLPKPADVVRMLQGGTQDSALRAWASVDRAVRQVGTHQSVAFDDALIHRVIHDMGGWAALGTKTDDEWPFVAREFENRYRGYRMRSETPPFPRVLIGLAEAQNSRQGRASQPAVLVGDAARARDVMLMGTDQPLVGFTRAEHEAPPVLALVKKAKVAA